MRRTFPSRTSALAALLVAPLALIVAGCSMEMEPPQPRYEVTHNFIPPASDMGRMCAAQCLTSKDQCLTTKQLSTELAKEHCENDERERARKDYASYAKSRKDKGKKVDRTEDSFYSRARCERAGGTLSNCNENYHQCYTTCGGQVVAQSICVANCDLVAMAPVTTAQPGSPAPVTTGSIPPAQMPPAAAAH
jgi:hypothetical protein